MSNKYLEDYEAGLAIEEAKPQLKKPRLYKVLIMNDDFTPMDFVVDILKFYFGKDQETATRIMLQVHAHGKGICGVYSRDIAETKVVQVNEHSQSNEHPLLCMMEPE